MQNTTARILRGAAFLTAFYATRVAIRLHITRRADRARYAGWERR